MKFKNKLFLPFLTILFSCLGNKEESTRDESSLVLVDSLIVFMDEKSIPEFNFHQISSFKGKESLINLNLANYSIDFFDLDNGSLIHRIQIQTDGPDRINNVSGFFYHNEDTVLLYPKMTLTNTALVNFEGEVLNRYVPNYPSELEIPNIINHFSNALSPTYFLNNSIYFEQGLLKNTSAPGILNEEYKLAGKLDIRNESISLFPNSGYPDFYKEKFYPIYLSLASRIVNHQNQWIYSWNALDSILVYDMDYNLKNTIFSKSRFRKGHISHKPNSSFDEELEILISQTYYCKILFDPYRKKYFRFVQIGRSYDSKSDNTINAVFKNDFSIMVYDEEFNLIFESFFKGGKYNFYHAFKKGLYLPRTNPNFPGYSDDEVTIDIYHSP